jgi:hypothetical protein
MAEQENEQNYIDYTGYGWKDLAIAFRDLESRIADLDGQKAILYNEFENLRKKIVPERMEKEGMQNVTVRGIGRFSITADMYCNTPADKRFELQEWLMERGFGNLIQPTVNGSTLKAFIKEQIKAGEDIPSDIVKIEPYVRASLTKIPD